VTFTLPSELLEDLSHTQGRTAGWAASRPWSLARCGEKITRDRYLDRLGQEWGDIDPEVMAQAMVSPTGSPAASGAA